MLGLVVNIVSILPVMLVRRLSVNMFCRVCAVQGGRDGQRGVVRRPRTGRAAAGWAVRQSADMAHPRRADRRHDDRTWCIARRGVTYWLYGGEDHVCQGRA